MSCHEVFSVERDDFVAAVGEATSLRGSRLYHLHVVLVIVVVGAVSLESLVLFMLELRSL
jgi:hypothetical protein